MGSVVWPSEQCTSAYWLIVLFKNPNYICLCEVWWAPGLVLWGQRIWLFPKITINSQFQGLYPRQVLGEWQWAERCHPFGSRTKLLKSSLLSLVHSCPFFSFSWIKFLCCPLRSDSPHWLTNSPQNWFLIRNGLSKVPQNLWYFY